MALSSSVALPFFKQAKHLTTLKIWPGVLAGSTVTWGTAVDLSTQGISGVGTFEAFQFNVNPIDVALAPADARMENMATERDSFDATVSELAPVNGSGNLKALAYAYEYFRVLAGYTQDGAASSTEQCVCFIAKRGRLGTGHQLGRNTDTLSFVPVSKNVYIGLTSGCNL